MDVHMINKETAWRDIPKSSIIFITRQDVLGYGLAMYHVDRRIDENGERLNDEQGVIYINGEKEEETPLGRLIHDFKCTDPDEMYYEVLAKRVRYYKEGEGKKEMCEIWDKIRRDGEALGEVRGEARGKEIGRVEGERLFAQKLFEDGVLTKEQFDKYINDIKASQFQIIR